MNATDARLISNQALGETPREKLIRNLDVKIAAAALSGKFSLCINDIPKEHLSAIQAHYQFLGYSVVITDSLTDFYW